MLMRRNPWAKKTFLALLREASYDAEIVKGRDKPPRFLVLITKIY